MSRHFIMLPALNMLLAVVTLTAFATPPPEPSLLPLPSLVPFPLTQVRVLNVSDSRPGFNQVRTQEYLLALDVNRLLYNFRVVANISTQGAQPYGGWEAPTFPDRGHFVGHYLSAVSFMFASTGDERFAAKATQLVSGLRECQEAIATGYVSAFPHSFYDNLLVFTNSGYPCEPDTAYNFNEGVPFYCSHKLFAGLIDWHNNGGASDPNTLAVASGLADHLYGLAQKTIAAMSMWQWNIVQNTEFGGMNEAMYNLHAITGDKRHWELGSLFEKACFLGPLEMGNELISTLHANTHLPIVVGEAVRYEMSGEKASEAITSYFWKALTQNHTYPTGSSSNAEHWQPPNQLGLAYNTQETCVSYNTRKITRHLIQWTADPKYAQFDHKLFLNGIMGTLNPSAFGLYLYYTPLASGSVKQFGTPYDSFWCCYGTGIENWSKLGDSIFFQDPGDSDHIYVHLFFPSTLALPNGVTLEQKTTYPDADNTTVMFHLTPGKTAQMSLSFIVPDWVVGGAIVTINGKPTQVPAFPGTYATVPKQTFNNGDSVTVVFPMQLYAAPMPQSPGTVAYLYGPVVLVGLTTDTLLTNATASPQTFIRRTTPPGGRLRFSTYGVPEQIGFMPLGEVATETYTVYFQTASFIVVPYVPGGSPVPSMQTDWIMGGAATIVSNPVLSLRSGDPGDNSTVTSMHVLQDPTHRVAGFSFKYSYVVGYTAPHTVGSKFSVALYTPSTGVTVVLYTSPWLNDYSYDVCNTCYSPPVPVSVSGLSVDVSSETRILLMFDDNDRNIQLALTTGFDMMVYWT